ncbi:hypothetical protein AB1285_25760 [Microbacterium sp. NRRL B-14842]|uniref:hypothetical protein n=1 Tax=Microbacterium sp. NRRL B-14842 TaxID=3162881 RepID=UPI003D2A3B79
MTDRIIDPAARDRVVGIDLADLGITDYGQLSRHGYWKANDVSTTPPMELFIDGQGMTLARWPNADAATPTVQMGDIIDAGPDRNDADLQERGGTFSYGYDRPKHWTQAEDVWLDGIFGYSWEWSYNKVESIDTEAKTITLRYGEMSGIMKSWFPRLPLRAEPAGGARRPRRVLHRPRRREAVPHPERGLHVRPRRRDGHHAR